MPGQGKYSNYSDTLGGEDKARVGFLGKLFSGGPSMAKPDVIARAKAFLVPASQRPPDAVAWGTEAVDMSYVGSPDISKVGWSKPGDPSTPYTPDVRSPGSAVPQELLGSTDTTSISTNVSPKDVNPDVSYAAFKPNYVAGVVGGGTRSPAEAATFVKGQGSNLGKSLPESDVVGKGAGGEIYKS